MKKLISLIVILFICVLFTACQNRAQTVKRQTDSIAIKQSSSQISETSSADTSSKNANS